MTTPDPRQPGHLDAPPPRDDAGRVDYRAMYDEYWSRDDRWGSDSFADADEIVQDILATCGGGRTLDVGCGMGVLVRTLLREGVDAHGVDIAARPVESASALAPGRFGVASILDLPFEDNAFDTVLSTDVLEHIDEDDVPRALGELARVARRSVFVRLATTPDRDRRWHLAIRDRAWWEERFFEAGLSRHPLAQRLVSFEAIDHEPWQITLLLEKTPAIQPPRGLDVNLERYRDIPRERSRAAEAASERMLRAAAMTRPGDTVLDLSSGLGWSSAILAHASQASRIIGLEAHEAVTEAARARNASLGGLVEHRVGTPDDLSFLADRSAHAIVAMDLFDQLSDRAIAEIRRVLTPSGRLIVGGRPGAHAIDALLARLGAGFLPERAWAQQLGRDGGDTPRRTTLRSPAPDGTLEDPDDADRVLVVLARDPIAADKRGYRETSYPDLSAVEGFHVGNYARDHDNPWLLPAMISMGMRSPERTLVESIATRALETARPGSPDEGAALCVLAYRLLEDADATPAEMASLLDRLDDFDQRAEDSPHGWRWRISNRYARGLLLLARGEHSPARDAFLACAELDVLRFSPLLASKTCDALFLAGLIDAGAGERDAARAHWRRALDEAHRVLHADWLNVWGDPDTPMPFGLPDLATLVELASRCANALLWLDDWDRRPGLAWTKSHHRTLADHRRRVERLTEIRTWLDRERGRLRTAYQRQRDHTDKLAAQRDALLETRTRLEERLDHLQRTLDQRAEALEQQGATLDRLSAAREELKRFADRQGETIADLRGTIASLTSRFDELRAANEELRARLHASSGATRGSVEALRARLEASEQARRELLDAVERKDDAIASLRQRLESGDAIARRDDAIARRDEAIVRRDETIAALSSRIESLANELASIRAGSGDAIAAHRQMIERLQSALDASQQARAWLESQRDATRERADRLAERHPALLESIDRIGRANETLREQIDRLASAREWLERQRAAAEEHAARTAEHAAALAHAAEARQQQVERLHELLARRNDEHAALRERLGEAGERIRHLAAALAERDQRLAAFAADAARVREALRWNAEQRRSLLARLESTHEHTPAASAERAGDPNDRPASTTDAPDTRAEPARASDL